MSFSIWDYLIPTVGLYLGSFLIVLITCGCTIYIARTSPKPRINSKIMLIIAWLSFIVFLIIIFSITASDINWLPLAFIQDRAYTVGVVEKIQPANAIPIYYDRANNQWTSASFITLNDTEYYLLTDVQLSVGDCIEIEYCPELNAVLQWESVSIGTVDKPIDPFFPSPPVQSTTKNISNAPLSPVLLIFLFGVILLIMFVSQKLMGWNWTAVIRIDDAVSRGFVLPRKLNIISCYFEIYVTIFAMLSFLTASLPLIVFLCICAMLLWVIRFDVQNTFVLYNGDSFTYIDISGKKTILLSMVQDACFVYTRQGYMQLQVRTSNGSRIQLSALNFKGLEQFFLWLHDNMNTDTGDGLREPG